MGKYYLKFKIVYLNCKIASIKITSKKFAEIILKALWITFPRWLVCINELDQSLWILIAAIFYFFYRRKSYLILLPIFINRFFQYPILKKVKAATPEITLDIGKAHQMPSYPKEV